jgi:hypothetical protein
MVYFFETVVRTFGRDHWCGHRMTDYHRKKQAFIWRDSGSLLLYCLQIYVSAILQMDVPGKRDPPSWTLLVLIIERRSGVANRSDRDGIPTQSPAIQYIVCLRLTLYSPVVPTSRLWCPKRTDCRTVRKIPHRIIYCFSCDCQLINIRVFVSQFYSSKTNYFLTHYDL